MSSSKAQGGANKASFADFPQSEVRVKYNSRDVLLFANGIGCSDSRFVYELDPNFAVFPTYPLTLIHKGDASDILPFPSPSMEAMPSPAVEGVKYVLDAERYLEKLEDLPPGGADLRVVCSLLGVQKKNNGALVEHSLEFRGLDGKVYYKSVGGTMLRGDIQGTFGGRPSAREVKLPDAKPTVTIDVPTNENASNIFRLSGDYNPMHIDPAASEKAGYKKPIIHGLCTLGHVARTMLDYAAGGDPKRFRSIQMRFSGVVIPGQVVAVDIWQLSSTELLFRAVVKETGKACLTNGRMVLNPIANL